MKIARLGDNMRQVAVTEGDKVEAEIRFGVSVNGYGLGDLVAFQDQVTDADVDRLCDEYAASYTLMKGSGEGRRQAWLAARRRAHRAGAPRLPRRRRVQRHSPTPSRT